MNSNRPESGGQRLNLGLPKQIQPLVRVGPKLQAPKLLVQGSNRSAIYFCFQVIELVCYKPLKGHEDEIMNNFYKLCQNYWYCWVKN